MDAHIRGEIDPLSVATHTGRDELIKFIVDVDEHVAEVDFTEALIVKLLESLRADVREEAVIDKLIKDVHEAVKEDPA